MKAFTSIIDELICLLAEKSRVHASDDHTKLERELLDRLHFLGLIRPKEAHGKRFHRAFKLLFPSFWDVSPPYLCGGLGGFLFAHLSLGIPLPRNLLTEYGMRCRRYYADPSGRHELLTGLAGIGVIASFANDEKLLAWALQNLEDTLVETEIGPAWVNRVDYEELFNPRPTIPHSFQTNLGLAHGILGPMILISKIAKRNKSSKATRLLGKIMPTVRVLERTYASKPIQYALPPLEKTVTDKPAGWCYGDPPLGLALIQVGLASNEKTLVLSGINIALRGLRRQPHSSNYHFQICHGTAGHLLFSERIFAITKRPEFSNLAIKWHRETRTSLAEWFHSAEPSQISLTPTDFLYSPMGAMLVLNESRRLRKLRWDAFLLTDE